VSPSALEVGAGSRSGGGTGRGAAARRRAAAWRRRRRLLLFGFAVLAVGIGVVLAMPLLRKTINEITLPLTNADVIRQQAAEKHLDPALIAAVIYAETKFDPRTSPTGALGLMQIMPQTAEFLARRSGANAFTIADLGTPQVNIAYGSYYLRYLLDEYHGNVTLALAAYNGGESNVDRWVADAKADGRSFSISDIAFPETRAYVQRVLDARDQYRHKYFSQLYG
jgi:soluble lytic murein transglycosylase